MDLEDGAGAVFAKEHGVFQHADLGRGRCEWPPDDCLVLFVLARVLCHEITLHSSVDNSHLVVVGFANQIQRCQHQTEKRKENLDEHRAVGRAECVVQSRVEHGLTCVPT